MSQKNVEVLHRCAEALNVGHWDAVLALYHPDVQVEFRDEQRPPGVPDVLCGREAVRRVIAHWTVPYDEFGAEVSEYVDADPWVICDTRSHSQGDPDTAGAEVQFADAYQVTDGLIVRAILGFRDVSAALGEIQPAEHD